MNWNQEQYQQLTDHYRDLPDADLLHLAASPEDLTEIAEEVLNKELAHRKLSSKETVESDVSLADSQDEASLEEPDIDWLTYAQTAPPNCIFEFATNRQTKLAAALLGENSIFHVTTPPSSRSLSLTGSRIVVRPEDAEQAAELLSQPIADELVERLEQELEIAAQDFVPPTCPACQASDAMLIAVDPTNRWLCESCDHEWDDPA